MSKKNKTVYKYTDKELLAAARLFISKKLTLRKLSNKVGISKSCLSEYFGERLRLLDYTLYIKVRERLNINSNEKAIRGGLATKKKFENSKCIKKAR